MITIGRYKIAVPEFRDGKWWIEIEDISLKTDTSRTLVDTFGFPSEKVAHQAYVLFSMSKGEAQVEIGINKLREAADRDMERKSS